MKPLLFILLIFITALVGCNDRKIFLNDFINIDDITKASVHNNYGDFDLSPSQISLIKRELKLLTTEEGVEVKVGMKGVTNTISEKDYHVEGQTHGKYVEITGIGCFKTNGLNFDNYKPE